MSTSSGASGLVGCVRALFPGVTSAMQPARLPLALLAVLFVSAFAPIVDLAAGVRLGPRGFSGGALSASELDLAYERARSAASRVAGAEVAALERTASEDGGALAPPRRPSLSELAAAVREGTSTRIAERSASAGGFDADAERFMRSRAADALEAIAQAEPRGVATVFLDGERAALRKCLGALFALDPDALLAGAVEAVFTLPAAAVRRAPVVFPLALLVALCAISFLAGGLCRMAAVHAGRGARLGAREGAQFSRARWPHLVALPLLPSLAIGALALIVALFAVLIQVPVLNLISAALFVVPLLVALLGAVLALVAIAGFPLMPAAVAVEECDAGDAITRAGALVLARPLEWILMLVVSVAALALGGIVVEGALLLARSGIDGLMGLVAGPVGEAFASGGRHAVEALFGPDRLAAMAIGFWRRLFELLGSAYLFGLACDLATRAYLSMRERVDGESPATIAGYGVR